MSESSESPSTNTTCRKCGCDIPALLNRCKNILMNPKGAWAEIKQEPRSQREVFQAHVVPLAVGGTLASWLGGWVLGPYGFIHGFSYFFVMMVLTLAAIYVMSIVLEKLAPKFEGTVDSISATKLVGYSLTPTLLGKFLGLIPSLAPLEIILSLYSLYILYVGIGEMTTVPESRRTPYFVMSLLSICGIYLIAILLTGLLVGGAIITQLPPGTVL